MRAGWRASAVNLLTVVIAVAVSLAALELLMRATMEPSKLVGRIPTRPDLNQWYHELRFWERYRDRPNELGRHDPLLGWDADYTANRIRGGRVPEPIDGLRAVTVGDSFAFGNEVAANENFSALLDAADNGLQVFNMGVPGYGIDQSYLKYLHYGAAHRPDVVLFGIYVGDYERSTMGFTTFSKPYLTFADGHLVTRNQPVPAPAAELERISAALAGRSYLFELLSHVPARLQTTPGANAYFKDTDELLLALLQDLRQRVEAQGRLLIVHIPRGESFTDPDPFQQEAHRRLLRLYEKAGGEAIDLDAVFRSFAPTKAIAERYYVRREDGAIGHLSPAGHREIARQVSGRLGIPAPEPSHGSPHGPTG